MSMIKQKIPLSVMISTLVVSIGMAAALYLAPVAVLAFCFLVLFVASLARVIMYLTEGC